MNSKEILELIIAGIAELAKLGQALTTQQGVTETKAEDAALERYREALDHSKKLQESIRAAIDAQLPPSASDKKS